MERKLFKGCRNYVFANARLFDFVRRTLEAVAARHAVTPAFCSLVDPRSLYKESLGDETDIVQKEMFHLREGDFVLRPEGTANLMSALLSQTGSTAAPFPLRKSYFGPMFRHERPQKGRYRQFWQFGVELLHSRPEPFDDVEVVSIANECLRRLNVAQSLELLVNNIGSAGDRVRYAEYLRRHFESGGPRHRLLSEDSKRRLERNPLRVLDSKDPTDRSLVRELRPISEFVSPESARRFRELTSTFDALGLGYRVECNLVRGLDYYNDFCFEYVVGAEGQAVLAGGRYDGLSARVDADSRRVFGVGFALGVDRLIDHFEGQLAAGMGAEETVGFLIIEEEGVVPKALRMREKLFGQLEQGVAVATLSCPPKDIRKRLDAMSAQGVKKTYIVGSSEVAEGVLTVRDLATRAQSKVRLF